MAELVGIRLRAELVVLCACQTGTGAPSGGDEPLGLGRVLLAAGARSAVVTLWPVNDASAALVMARFQALRADGLPAARALREATAWLAGLTADAARAEFQRLRALAPVEVAQRPVDTRGVRAVSRSRPDTAPYAHPQPQHWAPYVLIGR